MTKILNNYEKSTTVVQLRTGKPYASEFGDYENYIVTVDLEALAKTKKTTAALVVIHEIGHAYAKLSLGYESEMVARLMFENAARRGLKQTERKMTDFDYPPLLP